MFCLSNTFQGSNLAVVSTELEESVFLAVLQSNEKDPAHHGVLGQILHEADWERPSSFAKPHDPVAFSRALADTVDRWQAEGKALAQPILYLGLLASPGSIEVCHAGTIRAHFIQGETVVGVSKAHNFSADPPPEFDSTGFRAREVMAWWPSRWLGKGSRSPEVYLWQPNNGYSVVVCSEYVHRFRDVSSYHELLLSGDPSLLRSEDHLGEAADSAPYLIIRLDWLPPFSIR